MLCKYTIYTHIPDFKTIFFYSMSFPLNQLLVKDKSMKRLLLFFQFLIPMCLIADNTWKISGHIFTSSTKEPIPFVNIIIAGKTAGATTDIDGYFSLTIKEETSVTLNISHLSHEPKTMVFHQNDSYPITISLKPVVHQLKEVAIFPEENPAHRIIDSLIAHIPNNDPKNIPFYTCTIYEKIKATQDSTVASKIKIQYKGDTTFSPLYDPARDIFVMENVFEKTFIKPDRDYNKVIATKISGIKNPSFIATLAQLQSVSLYDPTFVIGMEKYISPVSKGSTKRYFFLLQDTTYSELGDTIFQISYRPRRGTSFNGLQGMLSINTNGWALKNATATPYNTDTSLLEIHIREMYRQLDNGQWFHYQIHSDYILKNITIAPIALSGRSYYSDINLSEKPKRMGEIGIEMLPDAGKKDSLFWKEYRIAPLTTKEQNTYHFIDSAMSAERINLESLLKFTMALMDLKIKVWKFNLDLDKILNYQEYQGLYLGMGISTNYDFSKTLELGGFWGYGFKDKTTKYGGHASVMIYRLLNVKLKASYSFEGLAAGQDAFYFVNKSLFFSDYYQQYFIRSVDYAETLGGSFFIDPLRYLQTEAGFYHSFRNPSYNYTFVPTGQTAFETSTLLFKLRYAFREARLSLPHKRQVMYDILHPYPIVSLNYTHGFKNIFNGDFDFNRIEGKIQQSIHWRFIGKTRFEIHGGYVVEDIPYSLLFSPASTFLSGKAMNLTLSSFTAFATMRRNEFVNDRYLSLFFSHDFKRLFYRPSAKVSGLFDFQPAIVTNIGWGTLRKPKNHSEIEVSDMHFGYFESGIMLRRLVSILDVGCMYRYGHYGFSKFSDNFVVLFGVGL